MLLTKLQKEAIAFASKSDIRPELASLKHDSARCVNSVPCMDCEIKDGGKACPDCELTRKDLREDIAWAKANNKDYIQYDLF